MKKIKFIDLPSEETPINAKNLNEMQDNIEQAIAVEGVAGDTLPIGSVVEFASDAVIPENWLLCNGQEVSRTEYNLLFAIIGTTWGEGDGSTTFNVPTKEGLVTVGKTLADSDFNFLGKTGGEKKHTLTVQEMPSHDHAVEHVATSSEGRNYRSYERTIIDSPSGDTYRATIDTNLNGGNQPHNNLQPYVTSNYIIKARQSSGVVATVVDGLNSDSETDALSAKQGKVLNERFVYSTEEKIIGTWIDGKPIYRKIFEGITPPYTSANIGTIPNLDTLIDIRGVTGGNYKGGSTWINLGVNPEQYRQIYVNGQTLGIIKHDNEETPYRIILEYTKTTD